MLKATTHINEILFGEARTSLKLLVLQSVLSADASVTVKIGELVPREVVDSPRTSWLSLPAWKARGGWRLAMQWVPSPTTEEGAEDTLVAVLSLSCKTSLLNVGLPSVPLNLGPKPTLF